MEVVSACSLRVGSLVWQAWSGSVVLTVVAKATFLLLPHDSRLADVQDPIVPADRYWNDDPRDALEAATDLVPFKRRAEVVLVGHAYAPYAVKASSLKARLCVAGADKTIEVFTDRVFTQEGKVREASSPFLKSPLVWRYAAGGPGTANPVGIRHDLPPDPYGQRLIPRMQPAGYKVTRPGEVIPPVGFGPISPAWPERLAKLHHHAATWDPRTWSRRPLPREIDAAYFNVAPPDQQVDAIRTDERIELENLLPQDPRLVTKLVATTPEAVVERPGQPAEIVPFLCDTMWIDTDRGLCSLTWRARIVLESPSAPGRVSVRIVEDQEEPNVAPLAARAPAEPPAPEATSTAPSAAAPSAAAPSAGASAAPAAASRPVAAAAPAPPTDPSSIERCAQIAASCALRSADTLKILAQNGLSEDDWDAFEHRWMQVLKKDVEQARSDRLAAYDHAYVARVEEERGPITPEAYARLVLAHERDKDALTRALRELGLPWGATPRIQRVFTERMAADPALAERVRVAMTQR